MKHETIYFTDEFADVALEAYIHQYHDELCISKRKAIIICPGGGYQFLSEREAEPIALAYMAAGLNAFVLRYSIKEKASNCAPLIQACLAIKYIREHCDELYVDPEYVFITGFSAGGHLSAWTGCMWHSPKVTAHIGNADPSICKPTATVLCYPVITADPTYRHTGSIQVLNGMQLDEEGLSEFSLENRVDERTSPAFIWHTAPDAGVPVKNSILYAEKLSEFNIPFELHIFPVGGHGLALCNKETWSCNPGLVYPYVEQWIDMAINWVTECPFKK